MVNSLKNRRLKEERCMKMNERDDKNRSLKECAELITMKTLKIN